MMIFFTVLIFLSKDHHDDCHISILLKRRADANQAITEVIFNTNLYRYEENMLRLIRPRITQIN